ncbi:hypothetical protein MYX07_06525 [Patescibacteria group bacterium AH-259-L07]|nr:hypothetical protein [Patescibacteria group bacterium AH-259-L07]
MLEKLKMGSEEPEKQIEPQDVKTKDDLMAIAEDYSPLLLSQLIEEKGISLTEEERKKIMTASIYGPAWRGGKDIYPDEQLLKDIEDSGVDFSEKEKAKILNRDWGRKKSP